MKEGERSEVMIQENDETENTKRKHVLIKIVIASIIVAFIILLVTLCIVYTKKDGDKVADNTVPVVETDCGAISGVVEFIEGNATYAFKGIPYAKPPVGDLRWRAPVRLSDDVSKCWNGVYAADTFGSQCTQMGDLGSEDCLFLNVYTPSLDRAKNLPVLVWIHGGALVILNGSIPGYHPDSEFVTSMNIVGVSMNYRLNAFGFLTLEELWEPGESYGNYGLMDQILALKWVQNNIHNFGGNPNLVTVVGHSSGGTSIFGMLASPMAAGLFHRAVSMSGSPKLETQYVDAALDNKVFLNKSGCSVFQKTKERKACLFNMSVSSVNNAIPYNEYPNWLMSDLSKFPTKGLFIGALVVVDPIVVQKAPKNLKGLSWHRNVTIPLLLGTMAQEHDGHDFHNETHKACRQYLTEKLSMFSKNFSGIVLDDLYANLTAKADYLCGTIISDVRVNCPSNKLAADLESSDRLKVYRYVAKHAPAEPVYPYGHLSLHAFHGWDSLALFNFTMLPDSFKPTENDMRFQRSLRENIKHFMVYGTTKTIKWHASVTGIFNKDGNVGVLNGSYHKRQCEFWNDPVNGFVPYAWIN